MRNLSLLLLGAGILALPLAAADAPSPERFARSFALGLFEGRDEEIGKSMTPEVKAAMTPAQSEQLRASLAAEHGAFQGAGEAWLEDRLQGFQRYRVPLRFEKATLDMRVVMDGAGLVAGLFFVPHVERPAKSGEPKPPVDESAVQIGDPGLPGTISRPAGAGPFPAVVLVHGSGPNDRDETLGPNKPFRDLAWGLAQQGVLVLRYDKRSYVRPDDLLKVGMELTVRHEVLTDARAALDVLRARPEVDAERIYVLGHSLGGTLAPRIAGDEPRPAGVIVLAGATLPLPEKMLEQTRYILEQSGNRSAAAQQHLEQLEAAVTTVRSALSGKTADPGEATLGVPIGYFRDLEAHDPPAQAAKLDLPVLVLQGGRDYQVTLRDFERWRQALSGRPAACLKVYDDLDHLFRKGSGPSTPQDYERKAPVDPGVIRDIAGWILGGTCPG